MNELVQSYVHIQEVVDEDGEVHIDVSIEPGTPIWRVLGMLEFVKQTAMNGINDDH